MLKKASVLALLAAPALIGCGSEAEYSNSPRPPSVKAASVIISEKRVALSPKQLRPGPVLFTVTNRSGKTTALTVATTDIRAEPVNKRATEPIQDGRTESLKLKLAPGDYEVLTTNSRIDPAQLKVRGQSSSSSDELLLP